MGMFFPFFSSLVGLTSRECRDLKAPGNSTGPWTRPKTNIQKRAAHKFSFFLKNKLQWWDVENLNELQFMVHNRTQHTQTFQSQKG
jgi:hypothetical protein